METAIIELRYPFLPQSFSQQTFTSSKSAIEILERGVKYVQS